MKAATSPSLTLKQPLGVFLRKGHSKRRWFVSNDQEEIYFCWVDEGADTFEIYQRVEEQRVTRFGQRYTWNESRLGEPVDISYASVRQLDDITVTLHSIAALHPSPPVISLKF